jgi:FKBP-type peptidyl-prolyl cis-trans isomerase
MSEEEADMFIQSYFTRVQKAKEIAILDSIKTNTPGIQVTESGLMYVILQEGNGIYASALDSVGVEYSGKFADGQSFDASPAGESVVFNLSQVIPGFNEGLQKVKEGGKIRLFLPSKLAYGERGTREIPGFSALIFDLTLTKVYPVVK